MQFFTKQEFTTKYSEYADLNIPEWYVEAASEMIFSHIGTRFQDSSWDDTTVPSAIKNASMEQLRFLIEHDIPFVDSNKMKQGGMMEVDLNSDISTLAQRMLGNAGYLYRGNPINANMGITIPFGD